METVVKKLYEAMFLFDSADAASDWDGVNKTIEDILEKADADVISIKKWDERRLAYDIKGKGRGTYILCYFNAPGEKIAVIEREVRLSEKIVRALVLNAEHLTQEDMEKETPCMAQKTSEEQAQPEVQQRNENSKIDDTVDADIDLLETEVMLDDEQIEEDDEFQKG